MPTSGSAKKRVRQAVRKNQKNRATMSSIRTHAKKVIVAVDAGKKSEAAEQLRSTAKELDKAVKQGFVHRNTAARRKSRLARMVARLTD